MNGCELLSEFRERRSEPAFAELVGRYTDLVFSVAKRRLNGDSLAEEVAQLVFVRLAKAAPKLSSEAALLGWLHRTSVHVAIDLWRADSRRRAREEKAVLMQSTEANETVSHLAAELDEALNELADADRDTLLLRFFDGRKMRELGEALGISEDAAKMRVGRSLEKLREGLAKRGIQTTAVLLAAFLAEKAVLAAPVKLVGKISSAGLGAVGAVAPFLGGTLTVKMAAAGLVALLGVSVFVLQRAGAPGAGYTESRGGAANLAGGGSGASENSAGGTVPASVMETAPDARKLLEGVARARNRIFSGSIEFERIVEMESLDVPGVRVTNRVQQLVLFDESKRRLEQIGVEYAYVGVGTAGERSAQTMRDRKMTHAAAVQEGLLEEFEARYVSAFDGAAVLEYRERGGKADGAVIANLGHGHIAGQFDPRCFGMRASGHTTVENGLTLDRAEKIELLGKETVDGESAWHIEVRWEHYVADYWVSVAKPERLLKHSLLGDVFVSRYATDKPRDPLPIEVVENSRGGMLIRFKRLSSQYNIPVDPSFCTLAGLGMPRGTAVTDVRSMRGLGYWTGEGLSASLPRKSDGESTETGGLSFRERVSFLETEPESKRGFEAATWILLNTPDGEEVAKAGKALLEHHLQNTNLFSMAERLEELRHRCQKDLLKGMLEKNPVAEIRCRACFSLAMTFRDDADYGLKKKETAEARAYFQRVISDFSKAGREGFDKAIKSEKAIKEIDSLWVGHAAPIFAAKSETGDMFKLSDYSGRVVVLIFRSKGDQHVIDWRKKGYPKFAARGVEFVDIVCEEENTQPAEWPSIVDGQRGPIAELFMVRSWTSTFIVGKDGKIRGRDLIWEKLEEGIEKAIVE